ncbi:porin family protein [Woeseia oceani]|uniref:TIGR03016 family PEP-CTERM system-associated outer membrane protein n=1 Tax=Woeseia oceani TaxID=1548547 RepID=A0A193LEQ5_9GAMM|nr:hypothetical protein [Woeseia oceani]ANO50948.1 hypothetical protein BA177_06765 [Woeseia oceani]
MNKKMTVIARIGLLLISTSFGAAVAADFGLELEAGIGHSDNIGRLPDNGIDPQMDEIVYNAGLNITYTDESARAQVDIRGSLNYLGYDGNSFGSEVLPALDAGAIFQLIDRNLQWLFQGNVGQQSIDPFSPVTPGNRQNVSYFTTGPILQIPLSARFAATVSATYSDVNYEEQPFDNGRYGAQVGLVRQISQNRSVSFNVRGERTEFDQEILNPPIERYDAFARFETEGARNELAVDLGWSRADRDGVETKEPLAVVEWRRRVSEISTFSLEAGTRVSDAAQNFRGNQANSPQLGQVQNQTNISAPFRENFTTASFVYDRPRTDVYVAIDWSDDQYEDGGQFDRTSTGANFNVTRRLGSRWDGSVFGRISRRDYSNLDRDDEDQSYGISFGWRELETLDIDLRFERSTRDSSDPGSDVTENRVQLLFRYRPRLGR